MPSLTSSQRAHDHRALRARSLLGLLMIGLSLSLITSCDPPVMGLSLKLSECLPSDPVSVPLSSGRGLSCYEVLQDQTSSSEAGCMIWESGQEVGSSPLAWRGGELSLTAEPNLQEGTRLTLHAIFLSDSAISSVSCEQYEEERARECASIEGCLLKLDSQPIVYEGGVATITFQNNDRCNSSTSVAFTQLEVLDELDNDCDGLVDERLGLGQPCSVGLGECVAEGEYIRSVSGVEVCNATPGLPRVELCLNDADEDCDGRTDEGFEELNQPCLLAGETTPSGLLRCLTSDRSRLTCVPSMFDEDTSCDGVDSDRDGRVDEGYVIRRVECEPGACSVGGYELCIQGRLQSTCATGASAPNAADLCDGVDSDCDGAVDEDALNERITCGQGACLQEGVRRCERTQWVEECTPLEPSEEQCDGADNDCDNTVDEDFEVACLNCPDLPPEEMCQDGDDNDCDGRVDEGPLNSCGVCAPEPVERCDGADNDCDDAVDEGVLNLCGFCGPEPAELCDGVDNDCDGRADEGYDTLGQSCTQGMGLCAQSGVYICNEQGGVSCSAQAGTPAAEHCDGDDNDCDGQVDEGDPTLNQECIVGTGECVASGSNICLNGDITCSAQPGQPQDEVLDMLDNDCDGQVDEGVELCNAEDDDGDGSVDEELTQACAQEIANLYTIHLARESSSAERGTDITLDSSYQPLGLMYNPRINLNETLRLSLNTTPQSARTPAQNAWLQWITTHNCHIAFAWDSMNNTYRDINAITCQNGMQSPDGCLNLPMRSVQTDDAVITVRPQKFSIGLSCELNTNDEVQQSAYEFFLGSMNLSVAFNENAPEDSNGCQLTIYNGGGSGCPPGLTCGSIRNTDGTSTQVNFSDVRGAMSYVAGVNAGCEALFIKR